MLRLVETNHASAWKPDLGGRTPSGFLHVRTPNALLSERPDLGLQVVTHEIELMPVMLFGGMNRRFCWRQREDQPSLAGVHGCQSEDVPEEETISRRILAVHDDMRTNNHDLCPLALVIFPQAGRLEAIGKQRDAVVLVGA